MDAVWGNHGVVSACPDCWNSEREDSWPDIEWMDYSRYSVDAPRRDSSGTGRWKGGDVALAVQGRDLHAWTLDSTSGENVEIYVSPREERRGSVGVRNLTTVKMVIYFSTRTTSGLAA